MTSPWNPFLDHVHLDEGSGATFMYFNGNFPARRGAYIVECFVAGLDYVAKVNQNNGCYDDASVLMQMQRGESIRCWLPPIVFYQDSDYDIFKELLRVGLEHDHPPLLIYTPENTPTTPIIAENRTVIVTIPIDSKMVSHLRIKLGNRGNNDNRIIAAVNMTNINIKELPEEFKDDQYIRDRTYLRSLADEAIMNDPIVGTSGFMPMTREGEWRKCMGGECPIGNLFTEALRVKTGSDFAVINSGGVRGPGWPAGEVRVSDLWQSLPFVNHVCTGVMSGVSIFRLLNHSTAMATFESTYIKGGDRLLQMSGIKMSYNTLVKSGTRLMSVNVWDEKAGDYLPLERLKLYTFATSSWMCNHFDQFPSLLGSDLRIEGEVPGLVDDTTPFFQEIVAKYLIDLDGIYDTSLRGSHTNDTQAFEPMNFVQTAASCPNDYYWQSKKQSCLSCPGGRNVKFSDELLSFLITPDNRESGARNVLVNRELFNVTLAPKSAPSWVVFNMASSNDLMKGSTVLQPGESIAIEFDVDISALAEGTTRGTVSFGIVISGNYPGCMLDLDINFDTLVELRAGENLNQISTIRPVGWTLLTLAVGLASFFSAWTVKNRSHRIVLASQPIFMLLICFGVFIMALSIIPMSIDDSIASSEGCSNACMATPWLVATGFAITFTALFAKLWRLHRVMSAAQKMRRLAVRERDALIPIVIVLVLNLVLLVCWTLIDPLTWHREFINGDPSNSYGFCKSEGKAHIAFMTLLIVLNGAAIGLACERAWRARDMGDDSFTESRYVGVACLSWLQVGVIGIPVLRLTRHQPIASYFVQVAIVFLICVSMLLFMFIPKMRLMSKPPKERQSVYQPRRDPRITEDELKARITELENIIEESGRNSTSLADHRSSLYADGDLKFERNLDTLTKSEGEEQKAACM